MYKKARAKLYSYEYREMTVDFRVKRKREGHNANSPLDSLALELVYKLFREYFKWKDVLSFRLVNSKWKERVDGMEQIWAERCNIQCCSTSIATVRHHFTRISRLTQGWPITWKIKGNLDKIEGRGGLFHKAPSLETLWSILAVDVKSSNPHIQELEFEDRGFSESLGASFKHTTASSSISKSLFAPMNWLAHLSFSYCNIPAILMAAMVVQCPAIQTLSIDLCILDEPGVESLDPFSEYWKVHMKKIQSAKTNLASFILRGNPNRIVKKRHALWSTQDLVSWVLLQASTQMTLIELRDLCIPISTLIRTFKRHGSTLSTLYLDRIQYFEDPSVSIDVHGYSTTLPIMNTWVQSFGLLSNLKHLTLLNLPGLCYTELSHLLFDLYELHIGYPAILSDSDILCIGRLNPNLHNVSFIGCQRISSEALIRFIGIVKSSLLYLDLSHGLFSTDALLEAISNPKYNCPSLHSVIIRNPVSLSPNGFLCFIQSYGRRMRHIDFTGTFLLSMDMLLECKSRELISSSLLCNITTHK